MVKYILITGGVISGIGKGVLASSTGLLLRKLGYNVTAIKIDPYLNIDAGTMSPFEHGEVFILDDGGEADLDLGNYERFLDVTLGKDNNITTGKIYSKVIQSEREGKYLGKTVQVVPHICNAIQDWVETVSKISCSEIKDGEPDICIIELGGTIGDIESMPFVEAMRQFQFRVGKGNFVLIHVSLIPVVSTGGEQKTKPTQSSVRQLRSLGLSPDMILCRSEFPISELVKQKVSQFCHVQEDHVLSVHNLSNIYHVPNSLMEQNHCQKLLSLLGLQCPEDMEERTQSWRELAMTVDQINNQSDEETIRIAMVGKYTGLSDSYLSIIKSITHASICLKRKTKIVWIDSEQLEDGNANHENAWIDLKSSHCVLVPGGFGDRGVEGKINACRYARENRIPFLGICLGFQCAVIEFARTILGWTDAHSEEFNPDSEHKVVIFMPEGSKTHMGGTMRLGLRKAYFNDRDCEIFRLYGEKDVIAERHRHRYEVNPEFNEQLQTNGMTFVAKDETNKRMEILELKEHPYFVGTQFHPEMKTRPLSPSPPFVGLVAAGVKMIANK